MSVNRQSLLAPAEVRAIVATAGRAPSVHNTQPWAITWDGTAFTLTAETWRGLTVTDRDGRELVISCGAAVFNMRLALRKLGLDSHVALTPSENPRLLARVEPRPGVAANAAERRMFAAIARRHTYRGPFEDRPVSSELEVGLQDAARAEGALLVYMTQPGQRANVLHLARSAERELARDPRVRDELTAWTPAPSERRPDGVPSSAYAHPSPLPSADELPARDFDLGRNIAQLPEPASAAGTLAVLATEGDNARDWLLAGQALQRMLLTATQHSALTAIHSQVVELAHTRSELRRELASAGMPQLLLRFGYAAPRTAPATTPRRATEDVLTDLTRARS
jgi:nitroreductase